MKIIIFNDEKEIIDVIEDIENPQFYGKSEVRWDRGGIGGINESYIIVEDNEELKDISDEKILEQVKLQTKIEIALDFERERVINLATNTLEEEQTIFEGNLIEIDKKEAKNELVQLVHEINNKRKERRLAKMGRPQEETPIPPNRRTIEPNDPPAQEQEPVQ